MGIDHTVKASIVDVDSAVIAAHFRDVRWWETAKGQAERFAVRDALVEDRAFEQDQAERFTKFFQGVEPEEFDPAHLAIGEELMGDLQPCPECGELKACGYDNEGRAWIHIIADGVDED